MPVPDARLLVAIGRAAEEESRLTGTSEEKPE
jgi:hypothetical protein